MSERRGGFFRRLANALGNLANIGRRRPEQIPDYPSEAPPSPPPPIPEPYHAPPSPGITGGTTQKKVDIDEEFENVDEGYIADDDARRGLLQSKSDGFLDGNDPDDFDQIHITLVVWFFISNDWYKREVEATLDGADARDWLRNPNFAQIIEPWAQEGNGVLDYDYWMSNIGTVEDAEIMGY